MPLAAPPPPPPQEEHTMGKTNSEHTALASSDLGALDVIVQVVTECVDEVNGPLPCVLGEMAWKEDCRECRGERGRWGM